MIKQPSDKCSCTVLSLNIKFYRKSGIFGQLQLYCTLLNYIFDRNSGILLFIIKAVLYSPSIRQEFWNIQPKTAVLYSTVKYCTVVYCTVVYCSVLYCTVLYCSVLYCTVLYCTVFWCTVHTVLYAVIL